MDAIQAANSGHPGTPIGIAPVTYTLWQRFLRFDPTDPIWPNRDRFVLSSGHASALLWSMLHLTGVQAVDPDYEILGRPAVTLDDLQDVPPARLAALRAIPSTGGPAASRRRPARSAQGVATSVGMAVAGQWLGGAVQPRRLHAVRLRRVRAGRRRLHDGGHLLRGRLVRRPPAARRTCAGSTTRTGSRSRGTPTSRSPRTSRRASSAYGWNVTTVADANDLDAGGAGAPRLPAEHERPDAGRRPQPHRLRHRRSRTRRRRTASRSARRACRATKRFSAGRRTPSSSSPTACTSTSPEGIGARGREAREAWEAIVRGVPGGVSGAGRRDRADAAPRAAGRLGRRHCRRSRPTRRGSPAVTRRVRC